MGRVGKGEEGIPNTGESTPGKKKNVFYSLLCGQAPLIDSNKMLTELWAHEPVLIPQIKYLWNK